MAFGILAAFLYRYPFYGIRHDGYLYALQALSRLYPESLGPGLDAGFAHQDRFTVFSPLYARAIASWGLEPAALTLLIISLLLLATGVLAFARAIVGSHFAWPALLAFVVLPSEYGADRLFATIETFTTPRTASQALVLIGVAFVLYKRYVPAAATLALAMLLHPLMATPGVLLAVTLGSPDRWRWMPWAAVVAGALGATLVAMLFPVRPLAPIDPAWLELINRSVGYNLTANWTLTDWQRLVVPLAVLGVAVLVGQPPLRRVAAAACTLGLAGLGLSAFVSFAVPVEIIVQGQPWRWMWLAKAVAAIVTIPVILATWRRGSVCRAVAILIVVAWLGSEDALGLPAALLALLFMLLASRGPKPHAVLQVVAWTTTLVLAIAVLQIAGSGTVARAGLAAGLVAAVAYGWSWRYASHLSAAASALLLGLQVAHVAASPRSPAYANASIEAYADWRMRIAPDETVMFLAAQEAPWLLLQRPSYTMLAPILFSREAAFASRARLDHLHRSFGEELSFGTVAPDGTVTDALLDIRSLAKVCTDPRLDFVVSQARLPLAAPRSFIPGPFAGAHLYACRDVRRDDAIRISSSAVMTLRKGASEQRHPSDSRQVN